MTPKAPAAALRSLEQISLLLERVLEAATADETEIVCIEALRGTASGSATKIEARQTPEHTLLVRVLDRGRVGSFRTGNAEIGELHEAVRQAVAQSRARPPVAGLPHLPADQDPLPPLEGLFQHDVHSLDTNGARDLLRGLLRERESAELVWNETRVAVFNSRGVRRSETVTAAALSVECGRGPGAGRATGAARGLAELDPEAIAERARAVHGGGAVGEPGDGARPVLLSPESAIALVDLLNRVAFSAKAYYDGTSFLREHMGVQVFDRELDLIDDGTDPSGIPFPFDLEGSVKRSVDLIQKGTPRTPTLDQRQAAVLGLPGTAHAIGGNDARAEHLFLRPGGRSGDELLSAADGGLWIGALAGVESLEPRRVQFRARAVGVREIRDGRLGAPLPDLVWEDSLLRLLSSVLALGAETTRRLSADGWMGGISAPALAMAGVESLRVAPPLDAGG